mgnify:CR=1 FL=1
MIKSSEQISIMAQAGKKLKYVLTQLKAAVKPGITTLHLDALAEELIKAQGAEVSFKGYQGYPFTLCTSVNDEVVHTFPSNRVLVEGDIISLDLGLIWQGWQSDSAITVAVGSISKEAEKLIQTTEEALWKGIEQIKPGNTIGDIGAAIQKHAEKAGFGVVRDLTGHGIGRKLHEPPAVPNYGKPHRGLTLQKGMVLAIEPMLTLGDYQVETDQIDQWTIRTCDGSWAAQFEHTVAITDHGHRVLTA